MPHCRDNRNARLKRRRKQEERIASLPERWSMADFKATQRCSGLGAWLREAIANLVHKEIPPEPLGIVRYGSVAWGTTPEAIEWLRKYSGGLVISKEAMEYLIAEDSPLLHD